MEPDGNRVEIDITDGWSLMQGAIVLGVEGIEAECGGACQCATCHCYIAEPWAQQLPLPSDDEQVMLQNVAAERRDNSRLACQIRITPQLEGMLVTLPERQR